MNKQLANRLNDVLKDEATFIMRDDDEISNKISRMDDLINFKKIIEDYDNLKPILAEYFNKKAKEEKWER